MFNLSSVSISQSSDGSSKSYRCTNVAISIKLSRYTIFLPIQARGPIENGMQKFFRFSSCCFSSAVMLSRGSQRSGMNACGSGKIEPL